MNLFKILANGHGTVNENNVSAFLGYLLDPTESHSLKYSFLYRFLGDFLKSDEEDNEFKDYEYKIFFEQEFQEKKKEKKEVVDIVIICYKTGEKDRKKSLVKEFLSKKKTIEKIILIENKINTGSKNKGQLQKQHLSTVGELKKLIEEDVEKIEIHSIYITPDTKGFKEEYANFQERVTTNSKHIVWKKVVKNKEDTEATSAVEILEELIQLEVDAKIDPLNEYTKHTLKAFIQFINNGFKSEKEEKKNKGKGIRDIHYTVSSLFNKYKNLLNTDSEKIVYQFEEYINSIDNNELTYRCSKTHPLTVFFREKKVFGFNKLGKTLAIDIVFRNYPELKKIEYSNKIITYYNNPENGVRLEMEKYDLNEATSLLNKVITKLTE